MQRSQRPDLHDPERQPIPQALEANSAVDPAQRFPRALAGFHIAIELANHDIGRMANNGTPDAGDIATSKTHTRLRQRAIALLLAAQAGVNGIHGALKGRELDHGVGDLARPEGHDALVEARDAFLGDDLAPALAQVRGIGRQRRLHAHFDSFEGAECDVGEEFGRGGCAEIDEGFGGVGEEALAVVVFEDLVGKLGGVELGDEG